MDDDIDDRALFYEALNDFDPTIAFYFTEDAEEALNNLTQKIISIPDIIFLDINLPVMSGWQLLKQLKSDDGFKNIPVVMYSTSSSPRDKDIANDLGAESFITKPRDYKSIKNVLRVVINNLKH